MQRSVAQIQREAASIPEGMRVLPDAERLQTVGALAQNRAETEAKLQVRSRGSVFMKAPPYAWV